MATIVNSNLGQLPVITNPAGLIATQDNFIDLYDYYQKFAPEALPYFYYTRGKEDMTGVFDCIGARKNTYASDEVKHSEAPSLHGKAFDVSVNEGTNTFTCPTPHNLQVGMEILISDGVVEHEAYVSQITSDVAFVALNKKEGAYGFSGNVDIVLTYTNSWQKGTGTFEKGYTWEPEIYTNYSQIIKWIDRTNNSDRAHRTWLALPDGTTGWFDFNQQRSRDLFRNFKVFTHMFRQRTEPNSLAGLANPALGMKSVRQQVEEGGLMINGYIESIADLESIAAESIAINPDIDEFLILCDVRQMNYLNAFASQVNASLVDSGFFGMFNNAENMFLALDFTSVKVSGIKFHFKMWNALNNPSLFTGGNFNSTGVSFFAIPLGTKEITMGNRNVRRPFLNLMSREYGNEKRGDEVKVFGRGGTQISEDATRYEFLTEETNQVIGVASWAIGRRSDYYTGGSTSV